MASTLLGRAFWWLVVGTVVAQVLLGGFAVNSLAAISRSTYQVFSLRSAGEPVVLTPLGMIVPATLLLLYSVSVGSACLIHRLVRARGLLTISSSVSIAIVVTWWILLGVADAQDWGANRIITQDETAWAARADNSAVSWFFLASGKLPHDEMFGSDLILRVVLAALTLASRLAVVPLVWLSVMTRSRNRCAAESDR